MEVLSLVLLIIVDHGWVFGREERKTESESGRWCQAASKRRRMLTNNNSRNTTTTRKNVWPTLFGPEPGDELIIIIILVLVIIIKLWRSPHQMSAEVWDSPWGCDLAVKDGNGLRVR